MSSSAQSFLRDMVVFRMKSLIGGGVLYLIIDHLRSYQPMHFECHSAWISILWEMISGPNMLFLFVLVFQLSFLGNSHVYSNEVSS